MKAGAFALGLLSDPSVADTATNNNGFSLVKQPALAYHVLQLNGRHKPLDNIKVRQAIACAVDRQQVIDTAAFGDGTVTGPITSPAYQYSPTDGLPCTPGDYGGQAAAGAMPDTPTGSTSRRSWRPASTRPAWRRGRTCRPSWPRSA